MGNSRTIIVSTSGGEVEVRKLPLREYSTLLKALKSLPSELGKLTDGKSKEELKKLDSSEIFSLVIEMSDTALREFCNVLAIPTNKDGEFFLDGDLADAVDVLVAALELNDYHRIMESVKKLQARTEKTPQDHKPKKSPGETDSAKTE